MSIATDSELNLQHGPNGFAGLATDKEPSSPARVLIVGGGMASYGLCQRLVEQSVHQAMELVVFGDEPVPAYDRVNLSNLFRGTDAADLQLADRPWYEENNIRLETGCRIVEIDRQRQVVRDQNGREHAYDKLVLATGSSARVPPIRGSRQEGVFVYRTLADLESIQNYVQETSATTSAVIGGGLLGLEAAKVLKDLGLQTSVIEMGPGLMPKQLDAKAARLLKERIELMGVDVHVVRRTQAIERSENGSLSIQFANAEPLNVDLLIIAAGVVPNDELGVHSGLSIGERGGIVVDETLTTSDPNIFAIGECVSFRQHIYGLVAPCYRMADVLANRIAGGDERFMGADESAELKLMGIRVAAIGRAIGEAPAGIPMTQQDENGYRKIILTQGKVVGAACVGDWEELPQIRQAVHQQTRLWPWQRTRFRRTGSPWAPGGALPIADWPGESIVCACRTVTKGTLSKLIADGTSTPEDLAEISGASTACGSCRSLVCELAGAKAESEVVPAARSMLIASLLALLLVPLVFVLSPIPFADSVQSAWRQVDLLWRSDLARQITGYSLVVLMLVGLGFGLRKRMSWFQWGSYGFWRSVHAVLGTSVLVGMMLHTGMRLGSNLNLALSLTFLATIVLGAIAGILSSIEGRLTGIQAMNVRKWRPRLSLLHILVFWPLPLLIALHIFSFYWFDD